MGGFTDAVSDLFGGAPNNAGFQAQSAPLIQPVTQAQTNQAINTAGTGLNNAQQLATLLGGQATQGANTQNALTTALQNQANGVGSNPIEAAFNQNTAANVANQAALQAGQRGGSSNVGLLAREIGQQGAATQQQAAGQAATLDAQQRLAAQQQLEGLASNQINQGQNALTSANSTAQQNQQTLLNSLAGYNTNQVQNTSSQNAANAGIAGANAQSLGNVFGGLLSGGGAAIGLAAAHGGEISSPHQILAKALENKKFPAHLKAIAAIHHPNVMKMAVGGVVPMKQGGQVPGQPLFPGKDTEKQDVVPAMLTSKEIVLPLSVTQSKNPGEAAKAFVENIKGKDKDAHFKQALKEHVKNRKSKKNEKA